jgi:hypothetical protein
MRSEEAHVIDEDLADLEHKIQRLKIEYDQFFMGAMRREPSLLKSEVQRVITKYVNEPPRNVMQKFKINTLTSRFQALRSLWGRTLREMEAGGGRKHRLPGGMSAVAAAAAAAATGAQAAQVAPTAPVVEPPPSPGPAGRTPIDRLLQAIEAARRRTGESAPALDRARLQEMVQRQAAELQRKNPGCKVQFRVVIENNRAKLKATLRQP